MKDARKIIRLKAEKKKGKGRYPEPSHKFKLTPGLLEDMKSFFYLVSSRHYLLKEEPGRFVADIDIKICRHDEVQDKDVQIGEALAFLIRSDFSVQYGSLFQVMSVHSQTLGDVYSARPCSSSMD